MSGLRTPVTDVYGQKESVPIVSARALETPRLAQQGLAAGALFVVAVPEDAQSVEISVENLGADSAARILFLAAPEAEDGPIPSSQDLALLAAAGIPRRVPAGAQLVEYRAVLPGDRIIVTADAAVTVTVHAQRGAA